MTQKIALCVLAALSVAVSDNAFSQGVVPTINTLDQSNANSGPVSVVAIPSNAGHASGTSIGGLFTIPIARINGGGGTIMSILIETSWAGTTPLQGKIWQKIPTNSTCTDNVAFVGSNTDDVNLIGSGWFLLTPAAPLVTTGDAKSYASLTGITWNYHNMDTSPTKNVYLCLVESGAGENPGASAALSVLLSGPQN